MTPEAANQVKKSAKEGKLEGSPLRIAVTSMEDGSFHYAMGFDDAGREDDIKLQSEGIDLIIAPSSMSMLTGTVVDYVPLEEGQFHFIFMNPNDPAYQPPEGQAR